MQWSQILDNNRDFCLPHLHSTPLLGGFQLEYCHTVWHRKTWIARWWKFFEDVFIRFDRIHKCDGHRDTTWWHRQRLCMALHGSKNEHTQPYIMLTGTFYFLLHIIIIKITNIMTKSYGTVQLSCVRLCLMALTTMNVTSWVIHCHSPPIGRLN